MDCLDCPAGQFCGVPGLTSPQGNCTAGFFCPSGSTSQFGRGPLGVPDSRPCSTGTYCPAGSPTERPCPSGTFSDAEQAVDASTCELCLEGRYCGSSGLPSPTGDCAPGFYCRRGVSSPRPAEGITSAIDPDTNSTILIGGDRCPPGTVCGNGTIEPEECPAGTYQPFFEQDEGACLVCPAGFACRQGQANFTVRPCPVGYYCPDGTRFETEFPCPMGTFNNLTQRSSVNACVSCLPGQYCAGEANVNPDGDCRAGWFCTGGANTPTPPSNSSFGGKCALGEFCPAGSSEARPCEGGQYCASDDGLPDGFCQEGYYCRQGSFTPAPSG